MEIKTKQHLYNNTNGSVRQVCLPISTEYLIPEDDPVRLIDQVLSKIDYTSLNLTYSAEGRNPAVRPETLFKIMVYAYSKGIYSSRDIERACHMNLGFRYILEREKIPDHNTIARFRTKHLNKCIDELFSQLIKLLYEMKEVSFTNLFVDGTKIEANANKYTFVWRKSVEKNAEKLQTTARKYIKEELGIRIPDIRISSDYLKRILRLIRNEIKREKIIFVYGTGKHKTVLQRQYETISDYAGRQEQYEKYSMTFAGRNSFSKTDKDATFMHLKEDHMRNSQLKAAYNIQIGVESEYITAVMASSERSDVNTLIPFMKMINRMYGSNYKNIIADAGYESEENYQYLRDNGIKAFIKPSNYEYSKTKKFQRDMEFRLSMTYDSETDTYTCKNGKKLRYEKTANKTNASGFVTHSKVYRCENCKDCPYLGKCYSGQYNKTIWINETFDSYRKESLKNITSEEGIILRINRSIQAEGVFGITKQNYGFTRFLTRGKENIHVEYILLAFGFDLNKLYFRQRSGRFNQALFMPENLSKTA